MSKTARTIVILAAELVVAAVILFFAHAVDTAKPTLHQKEETKSLSLEERMDLLYKQHEGVAP